MDGDDKQMDAQVEEAADVTNDTAENAPQLEVDHLGYNPQLNFTYDPQLRDDRRENKNKLKRRFEHIFEKYERDFDGIGDEIDLETGEIVVDNGHLQNMRNEHDPGNQISPELLQEQDNQLEGDEAIVSSVEHSDVNASDEEFGDDEDGESDDDSFVGDVSNGNFSAADPGADSLTSLFEADESAQESDLGNGSSNVLASASLDAAAKIGKLPMPRGRSVSAVSSVSGVTSENDNSGTPPDSLLEQVPGLKESMLSIQSNYKRGQSMDQNAIQALGMSIANQLATFISRGGKGKSKRARDSTWSCPALPGDRVAKRQRSPSPQPELIEPSSSGKKSIWAPIRHPRQQKRKRMKDREPTVQPTVPPTLPPDQVENDLLSVSEDNMSVEPAAQQIRDDKLRTCTNCETSDSYIWRKGPDGVLCNTCGMYLYRYGLMRPIGPSMEGEVPMTRGDDPITPEDTEGERDPLEKDWWLGFGSSNSDKRKGREKPVGVRNSHFVIEEDALIIQLKEIDLLSWERMATYFPGRSAYALQCRYSKRLHSSAPEARNMLVEQGYQGTPDEKGIMIFSYTRDVFKEAEDELLLKLRDEDGLEWEAVAASLPGRSPEVVERRYNELAKQYLGGGGNGPKPKGWRKTATKESSYPVTKSHRYSAEEDVLIVKLREVEKLSWGEIAETLEGRNSFSLQKRYIRELCGRHPNSVLPARKAYDRVTPSLEDSTLEGNDRDIAPELHDSFMEVDSPTNAMQAGQAGISSLGSGSLLIGQVGPVNLESFGSGTTESQVDMHLALTTKTFTEGEDSLILKLRDLESLPWPDIAAQLPDRDISSISERYYHYLHPQKLEAAKSGVHQNERPQSQSPAAPTSSASKSLNASARKRWTTEEDDVVVTLRKQGKSWSEIATHLPARTTVAVKAHYEAKFDPNKKAYEQRVRRNSTTASKSQAPLLRQAVSNLRRRSQSALSFENEDESTDSLLAEESARPTQPSVQPLSSKGSPGEDSAKGGPATEKRHNRTTSATQRLQAAIKQDQISDAGLNNAAGTSLARTVQVPSHADGHIGIYPDTPARNAFLHSSSTEVTPVATALYATPARYNQQGHPYFLTIPAPNPQSHGQIEHEPKDGIEKAQPASKVAPPAHAPKGKSTKRVGRPAKQSKTKVPIKKASKKTKAKPKSRVRDALDDDSVGEDPSSDDPSDSDFFDAMSHAETHNDSESAVDEAESGTESETDHLQREEPLRAGYAGDQQSGNTIGRNTVNQAKPGAVDEVDHEPDGRPLEADNVDEFSLNDGEVNMQTDTRKSDVPEVDDSVNDEQAEENLPTDDSMDQMDTQTADEDVQTSEPKRPSLSYEQLVTMALESVAPEPLSTSEVYKFLESKFEYFRHCEANWKVSVRGVLSRSPRFQKASAGRKSGWMLFDTPKIAKAGQSLSPEPAALEGEVQESESAAKDLVSTEYVNAHPEETFHHRGQGRWARGLPPPGSSFKGVRGPGAEANEEAADRQNDHEVKEASGTTSRSKGIEGPGDHKMQVPGAIRRPVGRPRIHPKPPRRRPKHRKQGEEVSSSAAKAPDEIPSLETIGLQSSEDVTMEHLSPEVEVPEHDNVVPFPTTRKRRSRTRKPIHKTSRPLVAVSEPNDEDVRPVNVPSSDITREPRSELVALDTEDQQPYDESSLLGDSSELSIKANDVLAASSPIMTKRPSPSNKYGKNSTPGTGSSTLFSHSLQLRSVARVTPMRATPSAIPRIRNIAEQGNRKRIVYTPVRDFDESEDELAL